MPRCTARVPRPAPARMRSRSPRRLCRDGQIARHGGDDTLSGGRYRGHGPRAANHGAATGLHDAGCARRRRVRLVPARAGKPRSSSLSAACMDVLAEDAVSPCRPGRLECGGLPWKKRMERADISRLAGFQRTAGERRVNSSRHGRGIPTRRAARPARRALLLERERERRHAHRRRPSTSA